MGVKTKFNKFVTDEKIDNIRLYNRYKLLALNMFRWENLPTGITSDYIEKVLYENGEGVFFKHDNGNFLFLPSSDYGYPNILGEYNYTLATGFNFQKKIKVYNTLIDDNDLEKCGIKCKNNDLSEPSILAVIDYTNKMNDVEKAIDRNLQSQKFPYIIFTNSNNEFSMRELMKQVEEGRPVIYVDKKVDIQNIQLFNTMTPYLVNNLQDYKKELEQEILNHYGLSSTNNKRERLITCEVEVNNDYKDRTCDLMYKQRLIFCEQVNKIFNLDLKVINLNEVEKEKYVEEGENDG